MDILYLCTHEHTYLRDRRRAAAPQSRTDTRRGATHAVGMDTGFQGIRTVEDVPHLP